MKKEKLLKYSKVKYGKTKKQEKEYKKSNNTIILDERNFYKSNNVNFLDLKTLIIDEDIIKIHSPIYINECKANDIYIDNHENLGGITIPYYFFINNDVKLDFTWNKTDRTLINKINVIIKDQIITLQSDNIEKININTDKKILKISIENYNSIVRYQIDAAGIIEKEYHAREINEEDIKDNILDLRERDIEKYKTIYFNKLFFDKLIVDKNFLIDSKKYYHIFDDLKFNILEIIDDNDMRLFQNKKVFEINTYKKITRSYNKNLGHSIIISNDSECKIIYLDDKNNIKVIDELSLIKKYNCEIVKMIVREENGFYNYMIVLKDNNYKVIMDDDKVYELINDFKNFLLLNNDIYLREKQVNDLKNNNWSSVIGSNGLCFNMFTSTYKDYIKYKNRLNILKNMGLTSDAINYLLERRIHSIINTETDEGLVSINEINKFEIDLFNKAGEEYKKVKKLKK